MKELSDFTEANRKAWNSAMPYHRRAMDEKWDAAFANRDFVIQSEPEMTALIDTGIIGKDIVQLCCNNGLELLSIKRLGAARCHGFDICDEAIRDANRRSKLFAADVTFSRYDVYAIPCEFYKSFDLVYITIGAMCWLPDIKAFFAVAYRLLRPGGKLFIYEQHPFTQVLPWNVSGEAEKAWIEHDYFCDTYQAHNDGLDYYGNQDYEAPKTYEFCHTLADIITAILAAPFLLRSFSEHENDISCGFAWVHRIGYRLPLCYLLTAEKN